MSVLQTRLADMLRASPRVMAVLGAVRDLAIPDPLLFSGAIYQTAWNALTGRPPDHGVKDYDVGYWDADVSWDAEDAWIKALAAALPQPLDALAELRNQARVPLWFPAKFGEPYPPTACTADSLLHFVSPAFAVGARLEADGALTVLAPYGLEDLFTLRLAPNPHRPKARDWAKKTADLKARWPELEIEG